MYEETNPVIFAASPGITLKKGPGSEVIINSLYS